jgi:hypothetical protein
LLKLFENDIVHKKINVFKPFKISFLHYLYWQLAEALYQGVSKNLDFVMLRLTWFLEMPHYLIFIELLKAGCKVCNTVISLFNPCYISTKVY